MTTKLLKWMEECGYAWADLLMDVGDGAFDVVDEFASSVEGGKIWKFSFLRAAMYDVRGWLFVLALLGVLFPLVLDLAFMK